MCVTVPLRACITATSHRSSGGGCVCSQMSKLQCCRLKKDCIFMTRILPVLFIITVVLLLSTATFYAIRNALANHKTRTLNNQHTHTLSQGATIAIPKDSNPVEIHLDHNTNNVTLLRKLTQVCHTETKNYVILTGRCNLSLFTLTMTRFGKHIAVLHSLTITPNDTNAGTETATKQSYPTPMHPNDVLIHVAETLHNTSAPIHIAHMRVRADAAITRATAQFVEPSYIDIIDRAQELRTIATYPNDDDQLKANIDIATLIEEAELQAGILTDEAATHSAAEAWAVTTIESLEYHYAPQTHPAHILTHAVTDDIRAIDPLRP